MIEIKLYTFSKRRNSTGRPTAETSGETFDVVLKSPTSYRTPAFIIQKSGGFPYNYATWGDWYYFIDDVISIGNERFEVRCSLDILATLKTEIMATSAFVLYDTAANSEIPDIRLSTVTTRGIRSASGAFLSLGQVDPSAAIVVMGITSENGVSFFAVDQDTASTLLHEINNQTLDTLFPPVEYDPDSDTLEDIIGWLVDMLATGFRKMFSAGTAPNCITSAKQLPLTLGAAHGNSQSITLGQFPTSKRGIEIDRRVYVDTLSISIPWPFSDWRRRAPYTELYLYCPYFGMVALPTENLIGEGVITIEATIDLPTGESIFEVYGNSTNYYVGSYSSNIGGQFAIGAAGVDVTRGATSIVGATVAGAAIVATGGSAASMAAKLGAAAISGVIGGNTPSASTISGGGGGAALGLRNTSYIFAISHDTNVEPASVSAVIGTPTMATKQIGTLTGFVQTRCASVSAPHYGGVVDECNALLDGGVYIE